MTVSLYLWLRAPCAPTFGHCTNACPPFFVLPQFDDETYPGSYLDPLNLSADPDVLAELKVKEIKNGRLAMISFLGFAIAGAVTQVGFGGGGLGLSLALWECGVGQTTRP